MKRLFIITLTAIGIVSLLLKELIIYLESKKFYHKK